MMNAVRRWAVELLNLLIDEEDPVPEAVSSSAADTLPQPVSDAISVPEEASYEASCPPADVPHAADSVKASVDNARQLIAPNAPACRAVVFSDRAYSAICAETLYRNPNETGGVFLGQVQDGVWYVVEATDPGMATEHTPVRHHMDDDYLNHVYRHLNRMYRNGLDLLGLWHRHPGSFDRFSSDDMETNAAYAKVIGNGTLSMLVNIDLDIRLTCYYCALQPDGRVRPVRVPVLVGDRYFAGTDFLSPLYPDARIQPVTGQTPVYSDKTA